MPNTCNHVTEGFKTFELLFGPNQEVKESQNGQKCPFLGLL